MLSPASGVSTQVVSLPLDPLQHTFCNVMATFDDRSVVPVDDHDDVVFSGDLRPEQAPPYATLLMVRRMGSPLSRPIAPSTTGSAHRIHFPWKRVPGYVVAQFAGGLPCHAPPGRALSARTGRRGSLFPVPPSAGRTAMLWEMVLTTGLVSVILGTASGSQNIGAMNAMAVAGYIALAGLWAGPVSGASMESRALTRARARPGRGPGVVGISGRADGWLNRRRRDRLPASGTWRGYYGKSSAQGGLGQVWVPGWNRGTGRSAPPLLAC